MALFGGDTPYSSDITGIAGNVRGVSGDIINTALPQLNTTTAQVGSVAPIYLRQGAGGALSTADYLRAAGGSALTTGIATEESGLLPTSGQTAVKTNLDDTIAGIRATFAQLGMTGSTSETEAIADAKNRNLGLQFTLSGALGSQEATQGLQALSTSENIDTVMAQLGMQGFQLTASTLSNLVSTGMNGLLGAGSLFGQLAKDQIAQDTGTANSIAGLFKALAGNNGLLGTGGLASLFGGGPQAGGTVASAGEGQLLGDVTGAAGITVEA